MALARRCRYRREGRLRGHSGHRGEPIERQPGPRIQGWLTPRIEPGLAGAHSSPPSTINTKWRVTRQGASPTESLALGAARPGAVGATRRCGGKQGQVSRLSKFNAVWASSQYQRCFDASHGRCHISSEACCRGRPLLLSSRRSATAVDVAPRFSLLASAISSQARGSARKERLLGHPSVSAANAPATTQFAGLRRLAPPARATAAQGRASKPSVQDGGEDFGRPVVALVGRDCRIEPGEVVIARLTKLSRSVAGKLVVVRGAASRMRRARGCMGRHWRSRPRTRGSCVRRCATSVRGSRPHRERRLDQKGCSAQRLGSRRTEHQARHDRADGVAGGRARAERRDRQLHLPGADQHWHDGCHPGRPTRRRSRTPDSVAPLRRAGEVAQMTLSLWPPAASSHHPRGRRCRRRVTIQNAPCPTGLQTIRQSNVKGASAW